MSTSRGTLELALGELATILSPLSNNLGQENAPGFFASLGIPMSPAQATSLAAAFGAFTSGLTQLIRLVNELNQAIDADDTARTIQKSLEAAVNVGQVIGSLSDVASAVGSLPGVSPAVANALPGRIFDQLLANYLGRNVGLNEMLEFGGILEREDFNVDSTDPAQPFYTTNTFHLDQVGRWIGSPGARLASLYDWGTPAFQGASLLRALERLVAYLGLPAHLDETGPQPCLDLVAIEVVPRTDLSPRGIALRLKQRGVPATLEFSGPAWTLTLGAEVALLAGGEVVIQPNGAVTVQPPGATTTSGKMSIAFASRRAPEDPLVLLGMPGGSRLQVQELGAAIELELLWNGSRAEGKVAVGGKLKNGKVELSVGEGDGFLQEVLSGLKMESNFDVGFRISSAEGVHFDASGALEIQLPSHVQLGPIELSALTLSLRIQEGQFPIYVAVNVKATLGPLAAAIEGIGLQVNLALAEENSGNLGPLDLGLSFKPPNGVGLAIDAAMVRGGGFLRFDPVKEEYDGVLELDLSGLASVKAIGLITTRLPDGSKGFSLLLILTAEFGSPIQLGFGFTLSAVGGLLGLNRTMRLEVIATGIRDGGINSIMFPQNVVQNASRIISDLKNYFPVEADTFLIGPMAKIGWGTPNLVTVSLGIIIEIPGDIAILGVLRVVLPDEDAALIVIQVNFIGAIEFDKKRLWFFAALFESRVLFITLEGEMGLLVGWGDDASFVVSVGGFHPAFNPPPLPFGAIARIAISILNTDFARIRVQGYFAVTSNSVQFGAAVEIYFGVSAFNIDGHLAFDALFRFSPFYFIISISASLSVKVFGIGLFSVSFRGSLEGPTPWHVEGTGSISLLFFDIDVDFSHTWGNEAETTLPPISVMPLLVAELQKLENWRAALPASNRLLVSLRPLEQGSTDLVLHPVGSLKISQRAVPLGITIDKVGSQKPSDANCFDVMVSTLELEKAGDLEEPFAVGQYLAKSDSELLSAQSFAPMKSGVELSVAGEQYHAPVAVKRVVRYEEIILDTHYRRFLRLFFVWSGSLFALFLNGNAASKSVLSHKQQKALKPFADKVQVGKARYAVTFVSDNTAFNEQSTGFTSQAQAQDYMKQQVAKDGRLARQVHVIPQVEMQRAT